MPIRNETIEESYKKLEHLRPKLNLLIVTATDIETVHVHSVLQPTLGYSELVKVPHGNHTYFIGNFGLFPAVQVRCMDMGSSSRAASLATVLTAINDWEPTVVLMIGIAMGVDEQAQKIGDVLISKSMILYEVSKWGKVTIHRGSTVDGSMTLLDRFGAVNWHLTNDKGEAFNLLPGHILSGEKLINNLSQRNRVLKKHPTAIGAEMEGGGVYAACQNRKVTEWLIVKGICDYGDGNKDDDKEAKQNIAAYSATNVCLKVFSSANGLDSIGLLTYEPEAALPKDEEEYFEKYLPKQAEEIMTSAKQSLIKAFLELPMLNKIDIAKQIGIEPKDLINLNKHGIDRTILQKCAELNLFSQMWQAIHKVKPFDTNNNPFD